MITLHDTTLLALAKLRTRKIRTIITILLASLLFGVLVMASLVMTGAFDSIDSFRSDGLTSRYIVSVNKAVSAGTIQQTLRSPEIVAKAKQQYEQLVDEKIAEAKRLGITYTQASDRPPYIQTSDGKAEVLTPTDPNGIVHGLLVEKFGTKSSFDDSQLKSLVSRYHATKLFTSENYTIPRGSSLSTFEDGKEAFYDQSDEIELNAHYVRSLVDGNRMVIAPPEITDPFMLPHNAGWKPDSGTLPIILPQNTVEQLLGLSKLADTASSAEKLDRLKMVRQKAMSLDFEACYRNSVSLALIQRTIQQQKDMVVHVGDKDYRKPSLIYELPDPGACQSPSIQSDTRTSSEKKQDENQRLFDKEFYKNTTPASRFISFKVVGISPAESLSPNEQPQQNRNLNDIVNNLLKTSGVGQTIPAILYNQIPDKSKYSDILTYTPLYLFGNEDNKQRYVEFISAADATRFIDEQSCKTQYDNTCKPAGRLYQASLAFSNSTVLDDIRSKVTEWFRYAIVITMALAALIMWITIGRTITDSRRETAVFRAIGFKRIDIAMVYVLYTVVLSILIALFAVIIGGISAQVIDQHFSPQLTAQAQYGFGGLDMSKEVSLVGVDNQQLLLLLIACLTTGILGMIFPLIRNVHRNPINDMREE